MWRLPRNVGARASTHEAGHAVGFLAGAAAWATRMAAELGPVRAAGQCRSWAVLSPPTLLGL